MFKKINKPQAFQGRKTSGQRGQLVLLYAFLIPLLFLFVGVTFDLSWYYLNVSRMQNAADAAVIAGAKTLLDDEQSLSDFNAITFINGFDGSNAYESSERHTWQGDRIAKSYVAKNLARDSDWNDSTIVDKWTKNELAFESTLWGDTGDNFETLYYYQVMLEENVPHMFLNGWFPVMNAKVSAVVKITQYLRGYDLYQQMKYLGNSQTYSSLGEIYSRKGFNGKDYNEKAEKMTKDRSIVANTESEKDGAGNIVRYVENLNFVEDVTKKVVDDLFAGFDSDFAGTKPQGSYNIGGKTKSYQIHRIINIDTVYPVRDYDFYRNNFEVLRKLRELNPDYEELNDLELAEQLGKEDFTDPMYIRIESEPENDSVRQLIINVDVSNMDDSERPIIFFYEGPEGEGRNSLPVILNLNADFRGVLYAPNSPVVINGNNHKFQGFIIAESYISLLTEDDDKEFNYTHIKYDTYKHDDEDIWDNVILIDSEGNVQYKENFDGTYKTVEPITKDAFNLADSEFDSFDLVSLETYKSTSDNLLTTEQAKGIK